MWLFRWVVRSVRGVCDQRGFHCKGFCWSAAAGSSGADYGCQPSPIQLHAHLQVHFKQPVLAANICMGQEMFSQVAVPLWLSESLLTLAAKAFSSTTRVSVRSSPRCASGPALVGRGCARGCIMTAAHPHLGRQSRGHYCCTEARRCPGALNPSPTRHPTHPLDITGTL